MLNEREKTILDRLGNGLKYQAPALTEQINASNALRLLELSEHGYPFSEQEKRDLLEIAKTATLNPKHKNK